MKINNLLKIFFNILIFALILSGCQNEDLRTDDASVMLEPGEEIEIQNGIPIKVKYDPELGPTQERKKAKGTVTITELRDDRPKISMTYNVTSDLPRTAIRWLQIIKKAEPAVKPPAAVPSRPNFDCRAMTKSEYEHDKQQPEHLQNKAAQAERERRLQIPNPFMKSKQRNFDDHPGRYTQHWESYVILAYIVVRDQPKVQWKAEIASVWHWVFKAGENPRATQISSTDTDFQVSLNGAMNDFNNQFQFGVWYDGDPP